MKKLEAILQHKISKMLLSKRNNIFFLKKKRRSADDNNGTLKPFFKKQWPMSAGKAGIGMSLVNRHTLK